MAEATAINKSLSALGDVIGALAGKGGAGAGGAASAGAGPDGAKKAPKHVPYRNSKLTLLLQDALQPNGKSKVHLTRPFHPLPLTCPDS